MTHFRCFSGELELLDRSWGTLRPPPPPPPPPPPMGPKVHRFRSISDVSSFSTVSVLSFDPILVRALCVGEPRLGCFSSGEPTGSLGGADTQLESVTFRYKSTHTFYHIIVNVEHLCSEYNMQSCYMDYVNM